MIYLPKSFLCSVRAWWMTFNLTSAKCVPFEHLGSYYSNSNVPHITERYGWAWVDFSHHSLNLCPPWASPQCRASGTLLVGSRMTILLACLKYDWSSNTRRSEILMNDWGVQMEQLPAECYEHRHTSAPIIHAPSPLTETRSLRAVCMCEDPVKVSWMATKQWTNNHASRRINTNQ